MRAGALRHNLSFLAPVSTPTGGGGTRTEYQARFKRKARLITQGPKASDLRVEGGSHEQQTSYKATVRTDDNTKTVVSGWRVKYAGRDFAVAAVDLPNLKARTITMILVENRKS